MPKKLGLEALPHLEETTGRITPGDLGKPRIRNPDRPTTTPVQESSVDTPVIRRISVTGATLTEVLCQLKEDDRLSISIDVDGRVYYGKKFVFSLKPSPPQEKSQEKRQTKRHGKMLERNQEKPYFQTLIVFSGPENIEINLPTILISRVQRDNLAPDNEDYIIRRLQAAFYNIARHHVGNHLDEDPATCISRIPFARLQEAVRMELWQQGITLDNDGVFSFRGEAIVRLMIGADQCIRVRANRLFDILTFLHTDAGEEKLDKFNQIRPKIGDTLRKVLDVMTN